MHGSKFLSIIFVLIVLVGYNAPATEIEGSIQEVYKKVEDVELSLNIFNPKDHEPSDSRPAAVFFFGGGWNGGTKQQFVPHCEYLASRGMVGIVADYRVASRHKTTPFECVKDAKSAVRWIRQNASRLGIDPNKVIAGGGSAGGHIAAATATISDINEESDDLAVSAVPQALLLFNPVYDNGPEGYAYKRFQDRYKEISPMHNIKKGMPPTIVFLGTQDTLIPVKTGREFQKRMQDVGSRSELHLYPGQQHGFFNHSRFRKGVSPNYYADTVFKTDVFLSSLGLLEGKPSIQQPAFSFETSEGKHVDILYGDKPLARYMMAFDPSTKESRFQTYKPFLQVFSKDGSRMITKGAGGNLPHHRGIFVGFNIRHENKRYDLWHMKVGVQKHLEFTQLKADNKSATLTSKISWETNDGVQLIEELRTYKLTLPDFGYAAVELHSELKAVIGDVIMGGDPEHAGAQFRPADDIVKKETIYTFHKEGINPRNDRDLPWFAETYRLATGKQKYTVLMLNHPENPTGSKISAYRDYGRFGAFPQFPLKAKQSKTLKYKWIISGGSMPESTVAQSAYDSFVSQ